MKEETLIFKSFREYGEYCKKQPWYGTSTSNEHKPVERQVKCDMSRKQIDREMRNNRPIGYIRKPEIIIPGV